MRWDSSARAQRQMTGMVKWPGVFCIHRDIRRPAAAKAGGEVKVEANQISGGSSGIGLSSSSQLDYRTFSLSVRSYIVLR